MTSPAIRTNEIRGLTAEAITIQDNVVITGNLEYNGKKCKDIKLPVKTLIMKF